MEMGCWTRVSRPCPPPPAAVSLLWMGRTLNDNTPVVLNACSLRALAHHPHARRLAAFFYPVPSARRCLTLPKASPKWLTEDGEWDAVTAFGVRILKPEIGEWREVRDIFSRRGLERGACGVGKIVYLTQLL